MTKSPEPKLKASSGALGTETPQARVMQLVALAHNLCDDGRAAEAEDLARSLLTQSPNLASAQVVLARAWGEQGRLEPARVLLEQVVSRNPAFFAAHRWLAEVLVAIGNYPKASDVLLRAEAISPGQPRVAELIQQVMGAPRESQPSQAAEPPPATRVPPPPPPPQRRRRQTWEGPAVSDASPPLETLAPPPGKGKGATASATASAPTRAIPAQQPARSTGSQASWKYSPPAPAAAAPARAPLPRERRLPGFALRLFEWTRRHPSAVLTVAGVVLFTLAALTVVFTSWYLRPKAGSTREPASPTGDPSPPPEAPVSTRDEDGASPLGSAGFDELVAVLVKDRRLRAPRPTPSANRALLANALLASEYGRPSDRPTEVWADELVASLGSQSPPEDLAAARVLLRLARGDRAGAEAAARALGLASGQTPLIRFVEARRLSRNGEGAAALDRLGPDVESSPFPLGRLLAGELSLDRGEPDRALNIARSVLRDSPRHPLALQLLMEAHQARGGKPPAEEAALIGQACREDETRIPTLATVCRLDRALTLRRTSTRRAALDQALAAADVVPAEPRLLGLTSQALINLGAIREASVLLGRGELLADRALPPLAWARAGVDLTTNRRVQLPEGTPPGPEARLVAARAAFVAPPEAPSPEPLLAILRNSLEGDRDLQFLTRGARARTPEAAAAAAARLRERFGLVPPGPVVAYVGGSLARRGGLRPLARAWLGRALIGHGDACRATTLFRLTLREAGNKPLLNARLQRAIGRLGCDRLTAK